MDASAHGFGVILYHVAGNEWDEKTPPPRDKIQPILYLSKRLTEAETRYWPTELEVAGLVWLVRKLRHYFEDSKDPIMIFTDHSATTGIAKQVKLETSCTDKANKRLIRASQYLSQFRFTILHRSGKSNIIADALSRLHHSGAVDQPNTDTLNDISFIATYHTSEAQLDPQILEDFPHAYDDDPSISKILQQARENKAYHFRLKAGLLYFVNPDGAWRLVVPRKYHAQIFQ